MAGRGTWITVLLLAGVAAGCMDRGDDDAPDEDAVPLSIQLTGVDPYAGDEGLAVELTVGHLALWEEGTEEWVPLLTESLAVTLLFAPDDPPGLLGTFPVFAGSYTDAELVVDAATVLTPDGEGAARIDEGVCYTEVALELVPDSAGESLDLLVSGADALREEGGTWVFRPALVGAVTAGESGDATVTDPQCQALG